MLLAQLVPDPSYLNSGDNAWQLTAATLVGLMSVPGLAILYAGIMKRKWAVNSAMMVLYAFAMTLIVWTLFAYNMSFGHPGIGAVVGQPGTVLSANSLETQAQIPLLNGLVPPLRFPLSSMVYFQFVFAAITVIILGGSLLGRISFKAWALLVPLWITLVYSVGAFSLWGGGWLSQMGAVDFSGGYVIHVAAAVSGFTAAAVIGPRLLRDRQHTSPSNLIMAVAGGGLLWLGWAGFNGGDPYFANADAAAAILNTHLCTATALCTWVMWDALRFKKVSVAGAINGMVAGLVAITPASGFVGPDASVLIGVAAGVICFFASTSVKKAFGYDDSLDAFGVHCIGGIVGALLTGALVSKEISGATGSVLLQLKGVAATLIWSFVWSIIILKVLDMTIGIRVSADEEREGLDISQHGESIG